MTGLIPRIMAAVACASMLSGSGCDDAERLASKPLDPELIFGMRGRSFGQFIYPRAIDVDPRTRSVFVIDRSGRVQKFAFNGRPLKSWELPRFQDGYPTGVTIAPDGRLFVADTHNYRVAIFDQQGTLIETIGEFGDGPGQFRNPTDIAFGPDGRFYVSEFGGNDRVQVFDRDGNYLFGFGEFGSEPGQFSRPQSLAFSSDFSRLYVTDACNHRVQVFDAEGTFLYAFGSIGTNPGEFRYPYGVKLLEDGSVLISEFGNSRLQVLSPQGEPRAVLGRPGQGPGELYSPWDAVPVNDRIFVLDSRNDRVQVIEAIR